MVNDFGTSWRDGTAFIAIVNCIQPGTIDAEAYRNAPNRVRLEAAFQAAEQQLGVARLLDSEDVDVNKPDDKSIMTYVAQFLHKYPEPGKGKKTDDSAAAAPSLEQQQYRDFLAWLNSKNSLLEQLQGGKGYGLEYKDYEQLKKEFESQQRVLEYLRSLVLNPGRGLPGVTYESWQQVELSWQKLETQLRHWQWTLDTSLPGVLGNVGEWLNNAEHLLCSEDLPPNFDDEAANALKVKLDEHKHFFAELPAIKLAFETATSGSIPAGVSIGQIQDIAERLQALPERAGHRACRLRFLEHKCCILAFLDLTESKLKSWSVRYGTEETIILMLEQYRAFVSRNKLFQEFEKAFTEMQQVAEEYKREVRTMELRELNEIDQFIYSSGERWRGLSTGLRCAQGILEEVLAYWKRWNSQCVPFEQWLDAAEPMQHGSASEEEKMEFFQDIGTWKEKYEQLSETAAFLVTTCEPGIARSIKLRIDQIASRWEPLFDRVRHYLHAGEILRHRKECHQGSEKLEKWIVHATGLLASVPVGSLEAMKRYGDDLQQLYSTVDDMDNLLKHISRHFQSLVSELNAEELQAIGGSLKRQKETLVRIRALIAVRIQQYHQLRTQKESLEVGIKEIEHWLTEAQKSIESLTTLDTDLEATGQGLEKHQAFFSRLVNYKLLLDDKWKMFESMIRSSPVLPSQESNSDDQDLLATRQKLEQLTAVTEQVTNDSHQWEVRLTDGIQAWRTYQESLRLTTQWLHRAESLLMAEKNANAQQSLELHAAFFNSMDERLVINLQAAANQLLQWLPDESKRKMTVSDAVETTMENWQRLTGLAPVHRMKLEFLLDEDAFNRSVRDIDRQLAAEQQSLSHSGTSTAQLLEQHLAWFGTPAGPAVSQVRVLVERMEQNAACIPDSEIQQSFESVRDQWNALMQRADWILGQLQAIPQKWKEYQTKFDEMVQWMTNVDNSVANMSIDAQSLENFDRLREEFQAICSDVDARREGMKWLVQRLDSMLSYKTEEEGNAAQHQLEELIARYKNLVLVIEATQSKTDLLTKSYLCRQEIHKACASLEASPSEEESGDLSSLDADISKQEAVVKQLDGQRVAIVSLLQRGRDLQHHTGAPEFLAEEVQHLESVWNQTFDKANDKLKKLKGKFSLKIIEKIMILILSKRIEGSGRLWRDYQEQKADINKLLLKAEEELKQTYSSFDPLKIASELRARHEAGVELRKATEEILRKMRNVLEELSSWVGPDQRRILEEELRSVERRTEAIRSLNLEKITLLEDFSTRLKTLLAQVESIVTWLQTAQKLLQQLLSLNLSPHERVKRTEELQTSITEKLELLTIIQREVTELLTMQGEAKDPSGTPLTSQLLLGVDVSGLQTTITQMRTAVQEQSQSVFQDMEHWREYNVQANEVKPWLDDAEKRTAVIVTRPSTVSEMESLLDAARLFEDECKRQLTKLQQMSSHCQQMFHQSSTRDEVDALHSRWNGVHDTVVQQLQRLEQLQNTWTAVIGKMDSIVEWLDAVEAQLDSLQQLSSTLDSLENQLGDLKVQNIWTHWFKTNNKSKICIHKSSTLWKGRRRSNRIWSYWPRSVTQSSLSCRRKVQPIYDAKWLT